MTINIPDVIRIQIIPTDDGLRVRIIIPRQFLTAALDNADTEN